MTDVWVEGKWSYKYDINEIVKECPINMNGINTKAYLNFILLGSYDCLIDMEQQINIMCKLKKAYNRIMYNKNIRITS
jgi:hypothetical protein